MNKTVKWVLYSLNLLYGHIVVREKTAKGLFPLGGGSAAEVLDRFGDYIVLSSAISENILFLVVAEKKKHMQENSPFEGARG